jgi:hypothetical protein
MLDYRLALALFSGVLAVWAGLMMLAALPAERSGTVVAVFSPQMAPERIFHAVRRADGRLVNGTWLANAWIVHSDSAGFVGKLQAEGAWLAFDPGLFAPITVGGCFLLAGID